MPSQSKELLIWTIRRLELSLELSDWSTSDDPNLKINVH